MKEKYSDRDLYYNHRASVPCDADDTAYSQLHHKIFL